MKDLFTPPNGTYRSTTEAKKLDEKLLKSLREDSIDEAVIDEELRALADDDSLRAAGKSFRKRLGHVLESTPLEYFLVVLVIIDVIILLAMLVMDLQILHLFLDDSKVAAIKVISTLQENCQGNLELLTYNGSNLALVNKYLDKDGCTKWGQDANHTSNGSHARVRRAAKSVEGQNPQAVLLINVGHWLHILSIVILAIMVLEVLLKMFALGRKYFKGKLEVVDGIVIFISFAMDLYFMDGISSTEVNSAASILVMFLMWRIIRVFNALLVTAKKRLQFRIRLQKRMRRNLEEKISSLEEVIKTHESHIFSLEHLARFHQIKEFEIKACKPIVKVVNKKNTSAGLASMMQMSMGLLHGMNNINTEGDKMAAKKSSNLHEMLSGKAPHAESIAEEEEADSSALSDGLRTTLISKDPQGLNNIDFVAAVAAGKEVDLNASLQEKSDDTQAYQIAKAIAMPNHIEIKDETAADHKISKGVSNRRKHIQNNRTSLAEAGPLLTELTDKSEEN